MHILLTRSKAWLTGLLVGLLLTSCNPKDSRMKDVEGIPSKLQ